MADKRNFQLQWHQKFTYGIISTIEHFFYLLGKKIATHPFRTIAISWLFVLVSSLGLLRFYHEKNPLNLWVPSNSQFKQDSDWLMHTLDSAYRPESIIIEADNVLTPEVLQRAYAINQRVQNSISSSGVSYQDVCFRIPEMDAGMLSLLGWKPVQTSSKFSNETSHEENDANMADPSAIFNSETYCHLVNMMDHVCYAVNILDLWQNSERKIMRASKEEIVDRVNLVKQDPILKNLKNYRRLLGGVQRNESGHITGAKSLMMMWTSFLNFSAVNINEVGNYAGTQIWASVECLSWEEEFLKIMENEALSAKEDNVTITYMSSRSFGDVTGSSMFQGIDKLLASGVIMLIYVQLVISKLNCVEARAVLGGFGILSVCMAFFSACGICALLGIPVGPVHSSLPFLLMGLGVDDIFVIVSCWDQLTQSERKLPLPERVGIMLKHAGVAITVTTATDVLAFIVGATTVLPTLRSFCLYNAVGIGLTFIFVVTFFIACFTLDQKRLEANYNGVFPWLKHANYKPNKFSQSNVTNCVFRTIYSKAILTWPGKLFVVLITLVCFGISIESVFKLEQKFDPQWFVPDHTYLGQFNREKQEYYPWHGFDGRTIIGAVNYTQEFRSIQKMAEQLNASQDIISDLVSWTQPFRNYVQKKYHKDLNEEDVAEDDFRMYLSQFLFTPQGAHFRANFKFREELQCGQPVPDILMTNIEYRFKQFSGPEQHVPAMRRIINISKSMNLSTGDRFSTSWSRIYATWITDEIIDSEVLRNIQLALLAVMVCTSLLIANVQIVFWVFVMIILSMVNVAGFMQKWGLTIDIVSCVALQLAIGLCVDYATHVGHKFLTICEGDRHDRVLQTVSTIGSAVLFGGCSTLIGVIMLGLSDSYSFRTFFKIFLLAILFGLYNGVVLLPVILSWIGPKPYKAHKVIMQSDVISM